GPAAMIVTLTMNPSVDRTATLPGLLTVGGVNRIASVDDAPGGKGANVTRVLAAGGVPTTAVVPAPTGAPFVALCRHADTPATAGVRVNLTATDPDGTTTKLNEPGATPAPSALDALGDTLDELAGRARWMVLCGSLPRGVPDDFYADLVVRLRSTGARVAVDPSDAPLAALACHLLAAAPDPVKPNGEELGQLAGVDGVELERRAANGDLDPIIATATGLRERGLGTALLTLGGAGAVLVDDDEVWHARSGPVRVRSTVGAGDSS